MSSELLIAVLGGGGAMLGWGIADFFAKKTVDKIGDVKTLFWAQAFGIIPIFVYYLFNFSLPVITLSTILGLLFYASLDGFGYILFYKALEKGKVSIISPVVAAYAAFAVLISAIFLKETLTLSILLGIGIVFIGIMLTSLDFKGLRDASIDKKDIVKGIPEALVAVVLFSIWFPFWDKFVSSGDWLVLVLGLRIAISLIVLSYAKVTKEGVSIKDSSLWKWLLVIGLFDGGAYITLTWGFGATTLTSVVSVLSAAFSLPTLILARIFLKEKLQPAQWLGVLSIIGGLVWLSFVGGH